MSPLLMHNAFEWMSQLNAYIELDHLSWSWLLLEADKPTDLEQISISI